MKHILLVAVAALAVAAWAGRNTFSVGDGKRLDFDKYKVLKSSLANHGREVRTDYSLPGHVIHWYADGTAATNEIVHIDLVVVTNSVEKKIDGLEQLNVALSNQIVKAVELFHSMSNQWAQATAKIETIKAKNDEAIEKLDEIETKYPLLKTLIEKIKALIQIVEGK